MFLSLIIIEVGLKTTNGMDHNEEAWMTFRGRRRTTYYTDLICDAKTSWSELVSRNIIIVDHVGQAVDLGLLVVKHRLHNEQRAFVYDLRYDKPKCDRWNTMNIAAVKFHITKSPV